MKNKTNTVTVTKVVGGMGEANRALFGGTEARVENRSLGFVRINASMVAKLAADPDAAYTSDSGVAWITAEVYEGGGLRFVQPAAFRTRIEADNLKMPSLGVHRISLGISK